MRRFPLLVAALLLGGLVGCGAPGDHGATLGGSVAGAPASWYRVTDRQGSLALLEGAQEAFGQTLPDGRVWLYDERADGYTLLSSPERFGDAFFASGGVFVAGGVAFHVNFTDDPDHLYYAPLDGRGATLIATGRALGLDEIAARGLSAAPNGALRVTGSRLETLPDGWRLVPQQLELPLPARHAPTPRP
jgi:hypothetical protein